MRVVCDATHSSVVAELRYRSIKEQTAHNTEFLWQRLLLQLPRRPKSRRGVGNLDVLDDLQVPEEVADGLKKWPKFSVQPRIPAHELLSLNRRVSRKAQTEDQQRCLLDGVDCLIRSAPKVHPRKDHIKIAENYLKERDLRLLVSDKKGGFVVMTSGTFGVKAAQALDKNFIEVKKAALRLWRTALLNEMTGAGKEKRLEEAAGNFCEDGITPLITVVVDGGWSHRRHGHRYSANPGVAVIIGKRTQKLLYLGELYIGVRYKLCSTCENYANKGYTKAYTCYKNWSQSSGAM
ncbi:hypothetical protein HPB50_017934 [Hyalomma asiaticum]|uniref:Uncharacterized protein n=1 Tax=Hyalomma asiaticum TaxID=266040 RepID=A0ACB7T2V8_HYAAI|nr:hypothetical protein HPB50_017934 [Hyalomma asiaticum]